MGITISTFANEQHWIDNVSGTTTYPDVNDVNADIYGHGAAEGGEYTINMTLGTYVTLDLKNISTLKIHRGANMQVNTVKLKIRNLGSLTTISATGLQSLFANSNLLTTVDMSEFINISNINEYAMESMFAECPNLETVDMSAFNPTIIGDHSMSYMFTGCDKLQSVNLSSFNPENTTFGTQWDDVFIGTNILTLNTTTVTIHNNWTIGANVYEASYNSTSFTIRDNASFQLASAGGVGDPYIQPLQGTMYKLPDKNATYRILQDSKEGLYVNAYVDTIEQTIINQKVTYIARTYFNNIDANIYNFEHMYFFTKVCIHYNDESWSYNLLDCSYTDIPQWITLSKPQTSKYNSASGLYQNEPMIVTKATIANSITLSFAWFPNPQVNTGITLDTFTNAALDGLLIRRYASDSALVDSLDSTYIVKFEQSKNAKLYAKEIFHPHNQPSYVRRIAVL